MPFSRLKLLVGDDRLERMRQARVMICGLGGVGGWCAEMLARNGIGTLILTDYDRVRVSNINRQVVALHSTIGREKTAVMADRIADINPECRVIVRECRLTAENVAAFLDENPCDAIVDAIDERSAKLKLLEECVRRGLFVVSSMGAAEHVLPEKVVADDISRTCGCPLAKLMRKNLRKVGIEEGIRCVFSTENPVKICETAIAEAQGERRPLGSLDTVVASFGIQCAQEVMNSLAALEKLLHVGETPGKNAQN